MSEPTPAPDTAAVRAALEKIAAGSAFRGANRSLGLLRYVVDAVLGGRSAYLKEYSLGAEALERGPDFDPSTDPIARVEASRLRARLERYYANEGAQDEIVIVLPKGTYVPRIELRPAAVRVRADAWSRMRRASLLAAAAAVVLALGFVGGRWQAQRVGGPAAPRLVRLDVSLGPAVVLGAEPSNDFALSSDGRALVFVSSLPDGSTRLFARQLDGAEVRELPGTVGGRAPFFSPDGRWVGFWSEGKLRKTLIDGAGSPLTLAGAPDLLGASWNERGEIVASLGIGRILWRVPEDGGVPTPLVDLSRDEVHPRWPQWLPGGQAILFTAMFGPENRSVDVFSLPSGVRKTLVRGASYGRLLANGDLVYADRGTLFAVPFDRERLDVAGTPVPLAGPVADSPFGVAQFDAARDGTLIYRRAGGNLTTIAWVDAAGRTTPLLDEPAHYQSPRLSPDGHKLAYAILEGSDYDIWIYDLVSGARTRLTSDPRDDSSPVFTPDGQIVVHGSQGGPVVARRVDRPVQGAKLLPPVSVPWSFSPDGTGLAFSGLDPITNFDLWTVPIEKGANGLEAGAPELFHATAAVEGHPAFSPDGRFIAFSSNESGVWEVYVRTFPDDGWSVRISSQGGRMPSWSRTAHRLIYRTDEQRLMAVDYKIANGVLVPEPPQPWSGVELADTGVVPSFDLAPDGERVVALLPARDAHAPPRNQVTVLLNVFGELERLHHAAVPRAD